MRLALCLPLLTLATFWSPQLAAHEMEPAVQLFGSAEDQRGVGELARAYTALGVEHILTGYDHLAFVLALLFLVGFNRSLLLTITAFTAAHSLTLAMSALGLLTLRASAGRSHDCLVDCARG